MPRVQAPAGLIRAIPIAVDQRVRIRIYRGPELEVEVPLPDPVAFVADLLNATLEARAGAGAPASRDRQ